MMPITPISTVIELFYPEGFAHDYEWTTRSLGMKYFAVWNDRCVFRFCRKGYDFVDPIPLEINIVARRHILIRQQDRLLTQRASMGNRFPYTDH